jgi:Protein of unknown function (DUF1553)/Protein of unknown function (DUF1549)/F5/8 type C domain
MSPHYLIIQAFMVAAALCVGFDACLLAADKEPGKSTRAGPDFWSLQPIRRPPVPQPADPAWRENPIDAFIRAKLDEQNIVPNPPADARVMIRRLTLDLTGLLPTPEETDQFIRDYAADPPRAYEGLVDRLLASSAYGERWGRHWLDVVRFAESHGYEMNTLRRNAWPYRDYVIRAFNQDTPFPRFVLEQLAGDTIPDGDFLTRAATGFVVAGPHDLVGNATLEGKLQQRSDDLFDMTATTGSVFLGLTVGCARCHDHKFDPISQTDFYRMQAVFAGVEHSERNLGNPALVFDNPLHQLLLREELAKLEAQLIEREPLARLEGVVQRLRPAVNARQNFERFTPVETRFVRLTVLKTNDGTQPCIDELEIYSEGKNVATLGKASASSEYPNAAIHKIRHVNDGKYGNSFSWISNEADKGWIQIELPKAYRIDRIVWGRDRDERYKDRLAVEYEIRVSSDGKDWQLIAFDRDRAQFGKEVADPERKKIETRIAAIRKQLQDQEKGMLVYAGVYRTPEPSYLLKRGDVMKKGEEVVPAAIGGIGKPWSLAKSAGDAERRRGLAEWIADPANPLAARVVVNRVWHYHFGQGIIRTPSDFGFNGSRPSHPELLDWLASEYQANGWKLKPLHRLIVLSKTYRQTSTIDPAKAKVDASNRLLWRFTSRRLEAEAIRDTVLQTSGALDRRMGGPGYHLWNYSGYVIVFTPKPKLGPDEFRRMVYQFKPRLQQDGTFGAFDCPDGTGVAPRRTVSTTALQALNLLNDEFLHDQAERFAAKLLKDGVNETLLIGRAFRVALNRTPTNSESVAAQKLVAQHGLAELCRALFNSNEFVTLE